MLIRQQRCGFTCTFKNWQLVTGKCAEIALQVIYCNPQQPQLNDESSQYQRNQE